MAEWIGLGPGSVFLKIKIFASMKLRNTFPAPIALKQPWVISALGCPSVFLLFKWINFSDWWNIFHYIGVAALVVGTVLLLSKKFLNDKYTSVLGLDEWAISELVCSCFHNFTDYEGSLNGSNCWCYLGRR